MAEGRGEKRGTRRPIYSLWIGNIPFEVTEQELKEVLSSVGEVVNVRIKYDLETNASKGFAFCEYKDYETCMMALKYINGLEMKGRKLKLFWATDDFKEKFNIGKQKIEKKGEKEINKKETKKVKKLKFSNNIETHETDMENKKRNFSFYGINSVLSEKNKKNKKGEVNDNNTYNYVYNGEHAKKEMVGKSKLKQSDKEKCVHDLMLQHNNAKASISNIIHTLTTTQIIYILSYFQKMCLNNFYELKMYLQKNNNVAYALLHCLFLLNVITNYNTLTELELYTNEESVLNRDERILQMKKSNLKIEIIEDAADRRKGHKRNIKEEKNISTYNISEENSEEENINKDYFYSSEPQPKHKEARGNINQHNICTDKKTTQNYIKGDVLKNKPFIISTEGDDLLSSSAFTISKASGYTKNRSINLPNKIYQKHQIHQIYPAHQLHSTSQTHASSHWTNQTNKNKQNRQNKQNKPNKKNEDIQFEMNNGIYNEQDRNGLFQYESEYMKFSKDAPMKTSIINSNYDVNHDASYDVNHDVNHSVNHAVNQDFSYDGSNNAGYTVCNKDNAEEEMGIRNTVYTTNVNNYRIGEFYDSKKWKDWKDWKDWKGVDEPNGRNKRKNVKMRNNSNNNKILINNNKNVDPHLEYYPFSRVANIDAYENFEVPDRFIDIDNSINSDNDSINNNSTNYNNAINTSDMFTNNKTATNDTNSSFSGNMINHNNNTCNNAHATIGLNMGTSMHNNKHSGNHGNHGNHGKNDVTKANLYKHIGGHVNCGTNTYSNNFLRGVTNVDPCDMNISNAGEYKEMGVSSNQEQKDKSFNINKDSSINDIYANISLPDEDLVKEVIKNEEMLKHILRSKIDSMKNWTKNQRTQVLSIQKALLLKGYKLT